MNIFFKCPILVRKLRRHLIEPYWEISQNIYLFPYAILRGKDTIHHINRVFIYTLSVFILFLPLFHYLEGESIFVEAGESEDVLAAPRRAKDEQYVFLCKLKECCEFVKMLIKVMCNLRSIRILLKYLGRRIYLRTAP